MKWRNNLMTLPNINISRYISLTNFDEIMNCTLLYISDACERGYAKLVYIRLVNAEGQMHCSCYL